MSAEIIQFVPKPNPKLSEAVDFARSLNRGRKCAEPDCKMDKSGSCQGAGCILAGALSGVFPDFSSAAAYHASEKDPA